MRSAVVAQLILISSLAGAISARETPLDPGFEAFYNNDYDKALTIFEMQVKAHPDDPDQRNHVAQTILYRELFRNGSLESQLVTGSNAFLRRPKVEISSQDRQSFEESIGKSFALCEAKLQKDDRDVKAWYQVGVAHALRSTYFFLVEKAWMEALREASAARK